MMNMPSQHDGAETKNGYLDTELEPMFQTYAEMMAAMRQAYPPHPEPKEIKHVILDADNTMWDIDPWGVASLGIPVGHTEEDSLPIRLNSENILDLPSYYQVITPLGVVKLDAKLRSTLDKLREMGIPVSIASQNDKKAIERYLEAFGLRDQIADVEATWFASKDQMVKRIAKRNNVDTKEILFVDDSSVNCVDVHRNTDATALLLGYNIGDLDELLEFIK